MTARIVRAHRYVAVMDWKLELVFVPVTDVDHAKDFYVEQVGFHADVDHQVDDTLRFVQLTPPGSACSIAMGTGLTEMPPGSQRGLQVVVEDVAVARQQLVDRASRSARSTCSRGDPSSPSTTRTATAGHFNNCRREGRTLVLRALGNGGLRA